MKDATVLVTGGGGFIGSNLVKNLVEAGNKVTVLDNFMTGFRKNLDPFPSIQIIKGDVRNHTDVEKAIKGAEIVFHLAASVGNQRSILDPILDAEINVIGTLQVLEAARKEGVRKVVVSSSAGIFGELIQLPIKEDHPVDPDTPYGCTKLCEEKLSLSYARLYNIEVICLRYFNVYGPNQYFDSYGNVIPIFVHRMIRNEPLIIFGDGEQTRDFVHVNDVVQANIKAGQAEGITGAFNIASGICITINELAKLVIRNNDKIGIKYVAERDGDVRHSKADILKAKTILDYDPMIDISSGIKQYIDWGMNNL